MADIEAIIQNSINEAGISESAQAAAENEDTNNDGETTDTGSEDNSSGDEGTDAGAADAGDSGDSSNSGAESGSVKKEKTPVVKEETAEEKFAKEHGLDAPKKGKDNRIPYSRLQPIVASAELKLVRALVGDENFALPQGKAAKDVIVEHVGTLRTENTSLKEHKEMTDGIEQVMESDPERFLAILPYVNPRYAELLSKPAKEEIKETETPINMPEPDFDLGNGQKTYTPKSLQDALMWAVAEGERRATARIEKQFAPIVQDHQVKQVLSQAEANLQRQADYARKNWEGYAEYESDIAQLIASDKSIKTLYDAYIKVFAKKSKEKLDAATKAAADAEATARAKFMKEQTEKPANTSGAGNAKTAKKDEEELIVPEGEDRIDAIIKREMRKKLK